MNKCWDDESKSWIHQGYKDTGKRGVNPISGDTYKVMKCACGKSTEQVYK